MDTAKSFDISKELVWHAYKLIKANGGSAGVDEQSLLEFEKSLKDNLYRIWNRMASGSYFPPPVKAVEIPKKSGGKRILGIPTVSDRMIIDDEIMNIFSSTFLVIHFDQEGR